MINRQIIIKSSQVVPPNLRQVGENNYDDVKLGELRRVWWRSIDKWVEFRQWEMKLAQKMNICGFNQNTFSKPGAFRP